MTNVPKRVKKYGFLKLDKNKQDWFSLKLFDVPSVKSLMDDVVDQSFQFGLNWLVPGGRVICRVGSWGM